MNQKRRKMDRPEFNQGIKSVKTFTGEHSENIVTLDFTDHKDIKKRLESIAKTEFRHLDQQILYFLSTVGVK